MKHFKNIIIFISLTIFFIFFYYTITSDHFIINGFSRDYFVSNSFQEVKSNNFVTGIYLDYRLFDSFFETTLLFITTTGIIFMAKKDSDMD